MKLLYRLGFYLAGFSVGIILLSVIFKGKKTSCNYGPNDRVIMNLSKKIWHSTLVNNSTFDSISFDKFLDMASVDFNNSGTLLNGATSVLSNKKKISNTFHFSLLPIKHFLPSQPFLVPV